MLRRVEYRCISTCGAVLCPGCGASEEKMGVRSGRKGVATVWGSGKKEDSRRG